MVERFQTRRKLLRRTLHSVALRTPFSLCSPLAVEELRRRSRTDVYCLCLRKSRTTGTIPTKGGACQLQTHLSCLCLPALGGRSSLCDTFFAQMLDFLPGGVLSAVELYYCSQFLPPWAVFYPSCRDQMISKLRIGLRHFAYQVLGFLKRPA